MKTPYLAGLQILEFRENVGMRFNFRKLYVPILCLIVPLMIGCEETVQNPELPYEEKIVIGAYLIAGEKEVNVEVSRTLPLMQKYTPEAALVSDAEVTVIGPDGVYNAPYNSQTKTYRAVMPTINVGAKYELTVNWKRKKAKASTRIPAVPSIIKLSAIVNYEQNDRYSRDYTLTCDFTYDPNICVGLLNDVISSEKQSDSITIEYTHDLLNSLYNAKTAIGNGQYIRLKKNSYLYILGNEYYKYHSLFFAAFDAPYHAMNLSNHRYGNNDDIFGSSGSNPKFNISGDGIGYFIGTNIFPKIYWVPIEY